MDIPCHLISRDRYEREKAQFRRTYAGDHGYDEWVHFQLAHVMQVEQCPPRIERKDKMHAH